MNTKAFSLCWEGSHLILGTGKENQIFILRTSATIKFFHQILKKLHFGVKTNHYPPTPQHPTTTHPTTPPLPTQTPTPPPPTLPSHLYPCPPHHHPPTPPFLTI